MADFSKFDKQIDLNQLRKDMEEVKKNSGSGNYDEVPEGSYRVKCERLEIGTTKDGRPILKAMMRILEGDYKKQCIFFNRVLYGTKNDANMIASAEGWLESLEPSEDIGPVVFNGYGKFADLVMDIAEDVSELEYEVSYFPDEFNSVQINEVYE